MKAQDVKNAVKEKYSQIARQNENNSSSPCCGESSCCGGELEISMIGDDYHNVAGYNPEADLGLGCGVPTEFAGLKPGQHVLDLGSGAGNDCFVARAEVGKSGKVIGIDFSEEMVKKARKNNQKRGFKNVYFLSGDIEEIPLKADQFDVVLSNCVLNLVPDKHKAFSEIQRVLKSGGHFCVSDVVIKGTLPDKLRKDAEMYAGCVSGALELEEYVDVIRQAGFRDMQIHKQKRIELPQETLEKYIPENELKDFNTGDKGIFSITVSAYK